MSDDAQVPESIMDSVHALIRAADVLEACQRCHNHLAALLACWDEVEETDRLAMVIVAADRIGVPLSAEQRSVALAMGVMLVGR